MRGRQTRGTGGGATIGDTLSSVMKERIAQLKKELELKARAAIDAQLKQPPAPWQKAKKREGRQIAKTSSVSSRVTTRANRRARWTGEAKAPPVKGLIRQPHVTPVDNFRYWELPPEAPVREPPPISISSRDLDNFERIVAAGATEFSPRAGEQLFATIGLDFGTSSTKVIVRFPYEPGEPSVAIPAPVHCRREDNSYLWQTVIWVRADGQFIAWPERDSQLLYSLKQGVMGGKADTFIVLDADSNPGITRAEAATAFLAYVIRYVRGWLRTNRSTLFRGRLPTWFVNVGLPAENFDDRSMVSAYRRAASAALLMANFGGPLNIEVARRFLRDEKVRATADSEEAAQRLGIAIIPETAAEATGFLKSTQSAPGLYLMVDVGAMTFDVCVFRFWKPTPSEDSYSLFTAQVRPLGVEAFHWFMGQGKTADKFSEQCNRCLWEVVWDTKRKRVPNDDRWTKGNELPVFLVGGGARNDLHRERVSELGPWLIKHVQNSGIRLLDLPTPKNIDLPEPIADFNRLAVAWGLSYPPTEIGAFRPPSVIPDIPPPEPVDFTQPFVSKDQM